MAPRPTPAEKPLAVPSLRADLPPDLESVSDEPTTPLDLDAFERWAKTGEGDPWKSAK